MEGKCRLIFLVVLLIFHCFASVTQAGQVIGSSERDWAKKAVEMANRERGSFPEGPRNTVAVINYHNQTGRKDLDILQKGLAVMLISDLAKLDKIQVVERIKVQALLDEIDFGANDLVDPTTAPRLGRMLKAYYIAGGEILAGQLKRIRLGSSILDVPSGKLHRQAPNEGELNDLFQLQKNILFGVLKQLNVFLTPKERAELNRPITTSVKALFDLFRAIHHSDQGQHQEAAKFYRLALSEDPKLSLAKDGLRELRELGFISPDGKPPSQDVTVGAGLNTGDDASLRPFASPSKP